MTTFSFDEGNLTVDAAGCNDAHRYWWPTLLRPEQSSRCSLDPLGISSPGLILRRQREGTMRCISCGAEMRVVQTDQDDTMMVAGYAHQRLECTGCHEVETRTVFDRDAASPPDRPAPSSPPAPADIGPATLAVLEDERELDECEALLQNAIDMVRSPALSPNEGGAGGRAQSIRSLRAKISGPSRFVRIRHDDGESAGYVAQDTKSGMVVLRYQDSERLREMCEWLGWQVADDPVPSTDQ